MSCQVMYQPSQYTNYFPYHRQNIEQPQDNKQVKHYSWFLTCLQRQSQVIYSSSSWFLTLPAKQKLNSYLRRQARDSVLTSYSWQGIVDNDLVTDVSRESLNSSRESPNQQQQQQQQHTPTTNSPHFQSNDFDRTNYARHSNGASYNQDSSFSPQHNNNNNNNTMTFARSSERDQNMPPLIRAGDKTHAAHVSQVLTNHNSVFIKCFVFNQSHDSICRLWRVSVIERCQRMSSSGVLSTCQPTVSSSPTAPGTSPRWWTITSPGRWVSPVTETTCPCQPGTCLRHSGTVTGLAVLVSVSTPTTGPPPTPGTTTWQLRWRCLVDHILLIKCITTQGNTFNQA